MSLTAITLKEGAGAQPPSLVHSCSPPLNKDIDHFSQNDTQQSSWTLVRSEAIDLGYYVNTPDASTLSGDLKDFKTLVERLQARSEGLHSTLLHICFGFPCVQVHHILVGIRSIGNQVKFARPNVQATSALIGTTDMNGSALIFSDEYHGS